MNKFFYSLDHKVLLLCLITIYTFCSFSPLQAKAQKESTNTPAEVEADSDPNFFENTDDRLEKYQYPVTDSTLKTAVSVTDEHIQTIPIQEYKEIWGYLIYGQEQYYNSELPVTDIGYFNAGLSTFGELVGVPDLKKLPQTDARVHLVVIDSGKALTHFCLDPEYNVRKKLIKSMLEAAKPFDGLQIDFELVSKEDKEHYWSFLRELKKGLGKDKTLSIAIPARTKKLKVDAYDYEELSKIADRILVMAYDEHWSTSAPGPVASLEWCRNVATYATETIPAEKLIMGLPFYGRAWSNDDTAGAYRFSSSDRLYRGENSKGKLSEDTKITPVTLENGIPTFKLSKNVTYTFYLDNALSLSKRLEIYNELSVTSVGFWRLGQEDSDIWKLIKVKQ